LHAVSATEAASSSINLRDIGIPQRKESRF
jgi:hypothetical protein